nr:MAG TPA: hypothetical protein [Caudoviricetes sp.]
MIALIGYRAKARKELRRQPSVVPRRPPRPCRWTDPAGLAWSVICCTVWHGSITWAHRCTLIYLIIIGGCADLYSVRRGIWYLVCAGGVAAL